MAQPSTALGMGHQRNKSAAKARPRSSTKGPLDEDDDPLTAPSVSQDVALQKETPVAHTPPPSAASAQALTVPLPILSGPRKDLSYILRPEIYHPLSAANIPPPFRSPSLQPAPDTPLSELISHGRFRAAAILAAQQLSGPLKPDPTDYERIFYLLYVRLTCLTLIDATTLASQEVKVLQDLQSSFYVDEATTGNFSIIPWDLRVLAARLQAIGFEDPRREVMGYFDLAREARARIASGTNHGAAELWKGRIHDLGVRVASTLVEMGDLTGAAEHLRGMTELDGSSKLKMSRALIWLQLGDVGAAREMFASGGREELVIAALCDMADGQYQRALERWENLRDDAGAEAAAEDDMVTVNMAVCLLYLGRMTEGRENLKRLVQSGSSSKSLLFNLSTIYELCTDRSKDLKLQLAEQVAALNSSTSGWDKTNADFKL